MTSLQNKKVLVPFTQSFVSEKAFDCALEEADDGELILLHVCDPKMLDDQEMLYVSLRGLQNRIGEANVSIRVDMGVADSSDYLTDYALKEKVSLIVLAEKEEILEPYVHPDLLAVQGCKTRHLNV